MNVIHKIQYALAAFLLIGLVGCQEEIREIGNLEAPKNLTVSTSVNPDDALDATQDYGRIVVFFDFGNEGDDSNFYFDDITQNN